MSIIVTIVGFELLVRAYRLQYDISSNPELSNMAEIENGWKNWSSRTQVLAALPSIHAFNVNYGE